jgi:hypothetical protein
MTLDLYKLDHCAQELVLNFREKDPDPKKEVLNESHKMRIAVAFGLERFWGEQLRLQRDNETKAEYWKETWKALCDIMNEAGITIPNDQVDVKDTAQITAMAEKLWTFNDKQRKVAIAVLTELCDRLVWWTQRYKKPKQKKKD